jgi:hypothetical protein
MTSYEERRAALLTRLDRSKAPPAAEYHAHLSRLVDEFGSCVYEMAAEINRLRSDDHDD